jgi:hypothetical protein
VAACEEVGVEWDEEFGGGLAWVGRQVVCRIKEQK